MVSHRNRTVAPGAWMVGLPLLATALFALPGSEHQGPGVTEADLKAMIFGDNIPGFHELPAIRGGDGPYVELDVVRKDGSKVSRIKGYWRSHDELNSIEVYVAVYESQQAAWDAREDTQGSKIQLQMPAETRIGDASWMMESPPDVGFRSFVLGRTHTQVHVGPRNRRVGLPSGLFRISVLDGHHHEVADTLARGVEWALRQRPELLAKADSTERRMFMASGKPKPGAAALTFRGVTWAPLSALEHAGAEVKWDAKTNRATVSYHGKGLELRPFHQEANIGVTKVDLGATVLLGRDGPVVPVRKVAEALGIKVEVTPTTLRLG